MIEAIASAHYADHDEPFIIDKAREWSAPEIIKTMSKVQGEVKIIATVRAVSECLASFIRLTKPDNVEQFCKESELAQHLFQSYHALKSGYAEFPDCFLFVNYDDLVSDPQAEADRIAAFLGQETFIHDTQNLVGVKEDDTVWGVKGLHKVRKKVSKRRYSRRGLLGEKLWDYYQGGEFWNDKPEPTKELDDLDLQCQLHLIGEEERSREICNRLQIERPDCDRVAFNAGWFRMNEGHLLEGQKLLDQGRNENVFGNRDIGSTRPLWKGQRGTVLLNLEGGLGDQIHGYRFAKNLALTNRVVISCTPDLAPMFAEEFAVVQHEAACGAYHDYWLPSMSAVTAFNLEYADLDGEAYIPRTAETVPGLIGVKWSGNPEFEHEQHRRFPPELLFDAVEGLDCVSLQRDEGSEQRPDWMPEASMEDWAATRQSISACELVITSCTSIAHLSAAMGVPTWVVTPILPYYLWALPGDTTPWYNSMRLFRQESPDDWAAPFNKIKECLQCWHKSKMAA